MARLGGPPDVFDETLLRTVYGCAVRVEADPLTGRPLIRVAYGDRGTDRQRGARVDS